MQTTTLTDLVRFDADGPTKQTIFETERLWSEVLCLGRNQRTETMSDANADAILTLVAGEVVFQVGGKRKRLKQWGTVLVPAGAALTVANASPDPAVLLVVTAPPPAPAAG